MDLIVLCDASVLYPAPLRDVLIQLASEGLYRAKWTDRIHEEWIRSALNNHPQLTRAKLEKTRRLMNQSILDCMVDAYQNVEVSLSLPDADDRHVLAAAIVSSSALILTFNLRDFPRDYLNQFGIKAVHPDRFLCHLLDQDFEAVEHAIGRIHARLNHPKFTVSEYLAILEKQGIPETTSRLRAYWL